MSQQRKALHPSEVEPGGALLERPLTARSIIASLLLGMHPPRLSSARLVRWCSIFGIAEGTARVALSRMVERGELTAAEGVYELVGSVRERQSGFDWALDPQLDDWSGSWLVAVVTADARSAAARAELRGAMAQVRLGELREGVWARPANLPRSSATASAWAVVDEQCSWWEGTPMGDPAATSGRLFAPVQWAARAELLLTELDRVTASLGGAGADGDADRAGGLPEGFVALAAAVQHLRRDPLLPPELLPTAWLGQPLREAYRACQAAYADAVGDFFAERGRSEAPSG